MRSTQIPARRGLGGPRGLRLAGLALLVLVVSLGQGPTRARADEHAEVELGEPDTPRRAVVRFLGHVHHGRYAEAADFATTRSPDVSRSSRPMGEIGGMPFYISGSQFEVWKHTDLIIDVVPGRGGMFSLDNGRERRFLTRSVICAIGQG